MTDESKKLDGSKKLEDMSPEEWKQLEVEMRKLDCSLPAMSNLVAMVKYVQEENPGTSFEKAIELSFQDERYRENTARLAEKVEFKDGQHSLRPWADLFPDGRAIYYEGDDPEGFVREIVEKFNFDPSDLNPLWTEEHGYRFHCPARLLDDIYCDKYPMGS
jgi:hypothetical protein